eukprot:TRINITY_DN20107_c0_g1_i1.p1 TRINITY_DN20107_c0_g1~~TRINITY_DN20107_c0_g1_i1.p1  ORF type:complete len:352 (-),score=54.12 TRINITY_DN20107_c0_g1_i1:292-1347(-)
MCIRDRYQRRVRDLLALRPSLAMVAITPVAILFVVVLPVAVLAGPGSPVRPYLIYYDVIGTGNFESILSTLDVSSNRTALSKLSDTGSVMASYATPGSLSHDESLFHWSYPDQNDNTVHTVVALDGTQQQQRILFPNYTLALFPSKDSLEIYAITSGSTAEAEFHRSLQAHPSEGREPSPTAAALNLVRVSLTTKKATVVRGLPGSFQPDASTYERSVDVFHYVSGQRVYSVHLSSGSVSSIQLANDCNVVSLHASDKRGLLAVSADSNTKLLRVVTVSSTGQCGVVLLTQLKNFQVAQLGFSNQINTLFGYIGGRFLKLDLDRKTIAELHMPVEVTQWDIANLVFCDMCA